MLLSTTRWAVTFRTRLHGLTLDRPELTDLPSKPAPNLSRGRRPLTDESNRLSLFLDQ